MPLTFKPKRKKLRKPALIFSAIALRAIALGSCFYVFVLGAPQLDTPPLEEVAGISFQVKSFYSAAMGQQRKSDGSIETIFASVILQSFTIQTAK